MCGICGVVPLGGSLNLKDSVINAMTDAMKHRGPDSRGIINAKSHAFGHRRLKIIDLSQRAAQPMVKDHISLVFNGEIYNYKEIKHQLMKKGHSFKSASDTEVIIESYRAWGIKAIEKFNGMFALAIHDSKANTTYLVRDRLGIKPLYYKVEKNRLIFASEIKSILSFIKAKPKPNYRAISSYLSYRYSLGEESFFEGIYTVLPGHYLRVHKKVSKHQWWDIPLPKSKDQGEAFYKKKVSELLTKATQYRMIADVPLGAYLSGGLDSSILVALMAKMSDQPVKTYSIAFDQEGYNELKYAKLVADKYGTKHKEIKVSASKYLDTLSKLIRFKDAPLGVPNEIPLFLMSKILKRDITVVLSGEGADEIFSGYGRLFRSPFDYERLKNPLLAKSKSLQRKYRGNIPKNELTHFLSLYSYFPLQEKNKLFTKGMLKHAAGDKGLHGFFKKAFDKAKNKSYYDKISYAFEKLHLVGLLGRVDNSTMATSVEARVPFVDHELVEFMFQVPHKYKMKWNSKKDQIKALTKTSDEISENLDTTKFILRKAMKRLLPPQILKRKKQGFPVPLDIWFKGQFVNKTKKIILNPKAKIRSIFNQKELEKWIDANVKSNKDPSFGQKLWMILNLEIWMKQHF